MLKKKLSAEHYFHYVKVISFDLEIRNYFMQVVEDYNRRKREISKQQKELAQREEALLRHQNEVEDLKARWIGPLKNLIERINKNFSYFFSCMKCAGEVGLNVPENPVSVLCSQNSLRVGLNFIKCNKGIRHGVVMVLVECEPSFNLSAVFMQINFTVDQPWSSAFQT